MSVVCCCILVAVAVVARKGLSDVGLCLDLDLYLSGLVVVADQGTMRRANARNPKCGEIGRGGKNLGLNSLSEAPLGQANRLHERESPDGCEWMTSHKCDQVALRWNTRAPATDDRGRIRKVKRVREKIKEDSKHQTGRTDGGPRRARF